MNNKYIDKRKQNIKEQITCEQCKYFEYCIVNSQLKMICAMHDSYINDLKVCLDYKTQ